MLNDPKFAPWRDAALKRGYASSAVFPIMNGAMALGAINIHSRKPDAFSSNEVQLLTELTNDVSVGILALRTRAARDQAEEALRMSEEMYRTLFDQMTEEIHLWQLVRDRDGRILTWKLVDANPPALRTWGKNIDEVRGKTTDEIFGPGSTDHYMAVVKKVFAEGVPHRYEDYFPNLDRHFQFTTVPLGEYFFTTGSGITKWKQLEAPPPELVKRSPN